MGRPKKYPDELIARSVRLALESERPIAQIAADLGIASETLRRRVRQAAHVQHLESAGYVASGTVGLWWGERLEEHAVLGAGEFAYLPPDLPHVVGNVGSEPALIVVTRSSASDQDGIELLPELDGVADAG